MNTFSNPASLHEPLGKRSPRLRVLSDFGQRVTVNNQNTIEKLTSEQPNCHLERWGFHGPANCDNTNAPIEWL